MGSVEGDRGSAGLVHRRCSWISWAGPYLVGRAIVGWCHVNPAHSSRQSIAREWLGFTRRPRLRRRP